jgi:hypothetical protein
VRSATLIAGAVHVNESGAAERVAERKQLYMYMMQPAHRKQKYVQMRMVRHTAISII